MSIKSLSIVLALLILLVMGYFGYQYYYGGSSQADEKALAGLKPGGLLGEANAPNGKEFLKELVNLESLTLDARIFEDPSFISLTDYGVTLVKQPSGRTNPFSPVGND